MMDGNLRIGKFLLFMQARFHRLRTRFSIDFMLMSAGAFLVFHGLRLRRCHPALLGAAGIALLMFIVLAVANIIQARKVAIGSEALASLSPAARATRVPAGVKPLALPSFDATTLAGAIERESVSRQVSSDTFVFAVEDTAGMPYRRYRLSMEMVGRYPQIRSAIAGVLISPSI